MTGPGRMAGQEEWAADKGISELVALAPFWIIWEITLNFSVLKQVPMTEQDFQN